MRHLTWRAQPNGYSAQILIGILSNPAAPPAAKVPDRSALPDPGVSDEDPLELTADERRALIAPLRQTLDYAHFPLAPRLDPLKSILAKLDPPNQSQNRNRGHHCRRMPAPGLADIGGDHEPLHRPANDARQRRYGAGPGSSRSRPRWPRATAPRQPSPTGARGLCAVNAAAGGSTWSLAERDDPEQVRVSLKPGAGVSARSERWCWRARQRRLPPLQGESSCG